MKRKTDNYKIRRPTPILAMCVFMIVLGTLLYIAGGVYYG